MNLNIIYVKFIQMFAHVKATHSTLGEAQEELNRYSLFFLIDHIRVTC